MLVFSPTLFMQMRMPAMVEAIIIPSLRDLLVGILQVQRTGIFIALLFNEIIKLRRSDIVLQQAAPAKAPVY